MNKKFLHIIFIFILCTLFQAYAFAQETKKADEWTRLRNDSGEFSFEMPSNFVYFYDNQGFTYLESYTPYDFKEMQMFHASSENTVMSIEIYKVPKPKKYLEVLLDRQNQEDVKNIKSPDGFTIKQFELTKKQDVNKKEANFSFISRLIASKSHLYVVTVGTRGAKTQSFERFLSSIRLNEAISGNSAKFVNISSLKPITIAEIGENAKSNDSEKKDETDKPVEKIENPFISIIRPQPGYTYDAREANVQGTITFRLTFAETGRVSKIVVRSTLPNGLMRSAFFAALRIKFIPKEINNELVSSTKTVSYTFTIY